MDPDNAQHFSLTLASAVDKVYQQNILKSCIVCNFWSFNFRTYVSIFQEDSKITKIQVNILPIL